MQCFIRIPNIGTETTNYLYKIKCILNSERNVMNRKQIECTQPIHMQGKTGSRIILPVFSYMGTAERVRYYTYSQQACMFSGISSEIVQEEVRGREGIHYEK